MEDLGVSEASRAFWLDRPTLVTGATGLVGGWLVRRLARLGAEVTCLVRDWVPHSELVRGGPCRLYQRRSWRRPRSTASRTRAGRIRDRIRSSILQRRLSSESRTAIQSRPSRRTSAGTWALLEACRRSPAVKQIVLASSDKAYGEHEQLPYDESFALQGRHPYDVSKSCGDLIAQAYAETYGLPVGITRCGNFYGGGDLNWNRIVPGTIRSVLRGHNPVIRSDGLFVRDYFYVEDGAAAYTLLAERLAADPTLHGRSLQLLEREPGHSDRAGPRRSSRRWGRIWNRTCATRQCTRYATST